MAQIEDLERKLAQHPFFSAMSDMARDLIASCASNRVFQNGEYILKEHDPADTFFLMRHGAVAVEVHVPGRAPLVIETLGDGDILGWSWLVPPYKVSFDARAIGVVRLLAIDAKCLRGKCESDEKLGYEFYKHFLPVIVARLNSARLQLTDMYGHPAEYADAAARFSQNPSPPAKPHPDG